MRDREFCFYSLKTTWVTLTYNSLVEEEKPAETKESEIENQQNN